MIVDFTQSAAAKCHTLASDRYYRVFRSRRIHEIQLVDTSLSSMNLAWKTKQKFSKISILPNLSTINVVLILSCSKLLKLFQFFVRHK